MRHDFNHSMTSTVRPLTVGAAAGAIQHRRTGSNEGQLAEGLDMPILLLNSDGLSEVAA